jgi:Immunoglobulin domain
MPSPRTLLSASLLATGVATSALAQQAVVTQIPGLPSAINQPNSSPVAVNNAGHFAGMTNLYGFDPNSGISYPGVTHSFLATDPATATDIGVLGVDPPPFQFPRAENFATSLNSLDQMSAYGGDAAFFGRVIANAWLPTPAYGFPAGLVRLPSLTAPNIDRAYGINDSGIVVGESRDPSNNIRPVRWTLAGGAFPIDDIAVGFGPNGRCFAVNNAGQITGQVNEPNGQPFNNFFQAFLYLPAPAYGLPAGVNILQAPGVETAANFGFPQCINQSGQTFGRTAGFGWRPALWLPEPALGLPAGVTLFSGQVFPDSAFIRVDSVGLDFCQFNAANNAGVAVGEAGFRRFSNFPRPRFFTESHAFIWINGQFQLLEDYLPLNSPWTRLYWGSGINDSNVITAMASNAQGQTFQVKITLDGPSCPNGITRQPHSVTACAGETAAINVVVRSGGGGDVAYQWRKDGTPISDGPAPGGGTIVGSSTLQLQIVGVGVADTGSYDVIASNTCGTLSSSAATLTVNPLPGITAQPLDAFACTPGSASMTVATDDPNAFFAWQVEDPANSGAYAPISDGPNFAHGINFDADGSFTGTLTLSNLTTTGELRIQAAPGNDCGQTLSNPALLTIGQCTCTADFNNDGDTGTDADIQAFFACLAGNCCATCGSADFNGDGDTGTDADIESFFRVLSGGTC